MALSEKALQELKGRGVRSVSLLLENPYVAPAGQGGEIPLQIGKQNPSRADVETWLAEQDADAELQAKERHAQQLAVAERALCWARYAFFAAFAAVIVSIIQIIR